MDIQSADGFNHNRQWILQELITAAEMYVALSEKLVMEAIVALQRDMVEAA